MKKLLLGSVLSTALLLAACGGETEEDTTVEQDPEENIENEEAEATEEETEAAEEVDETETAEESSGDVETIKEVEPGEVIELENITITVNKAQINTLEVTEDLAIFLDDHQAGDTVENIVIEYTIQNNEEAPRDLFIDQSVVVTSTGSQIEPEMLLADNITASMLGAIEYTGSVPYIIEQGAGEEIEWIDVNIPAVLDGETYDIVAEETKFRIEF